MKKTVFLAVALTLCFGLASQAEASSHRETPNTWQDPCTDHTDLYAWVEPGTHEKLNLIQVYNGLHEPGQGNYQTSLCDDVLYEFHLARGAGDLNPVITYQIQFETTRPERVEVNGDTPIGGGAELLVQLSGIQQTYSVTRVDWNGPRRGRSTVLAEGLTMSPANIGPRTDRIAYGLAPFNGDPEDSTDSLFDGDFMKTFIHSLGNGEGRVWVGEADDPFFLDEDAIFDVLNLRGPGQAKDVFAGFNAMAIALEIPTNRLTEDGAAPAHDGTPGDDTLLGIWNTTSRRKVSIIRRNGDRSHRGPWRQVSRQGLPLVNAGLIGSQDQHKYLRTKPKNDVDNFGSYFLNPVLVRDLEFLGTYTALGVPQDVVDSLKSGRTDILNVINLTHIPSEGAHGVAIANGSTGDVLRVDMAIDSGFPNGRMLGTDVSDVIVTLVVAGSANVFDPDGLKVGDNVNSNDVEYLDEFPFLGVPHEGLSGGHGALAP